MFKRIANGETTRTDAITVFCIMIFFLVVGFLAAGMLFG